MSSKVDELCKKAREAWVESQNNYIEGIVSDISFLEREVVLKKNLLKLSKETLKQYENDCM